MNDNLDNKAMKKRGCLSKIIYIIAALIIIFLVYKFIASLGSADLKIESLAVAEKIGKSGDPLPGTILVSLKLTNRGSEEGNFCLDLENYIEARKLEGHSENDVPKVWNFKTELYYPAEKLWKEISNSQYWSGDKITPGALEITILDKNSLDLKLYLKNKRGWKIKNIQEDNPPHKIKIKLYSPSGKEKEIREVEIKSGT